MDTAGLRQINLIQMAGRCRPSRRRALGLFGAALAAGALAVAGPGHGGRGTATAQTGTDEQIQADIQATLDRFAEARRTGNEALLRDVLDSTNLPFRRIVLDQFHNWQRLAEQNRLRPVEYTVTRVRPALSGLYKADFTARFPAFREFGASTAVGTYVFRNVDGRWLLSEPLESELGARKLMQTEHFRIRYFEWDAGQIDHLAQLFEEAYRLDVAKAGFDAPEQIYVTVSPTFAVNPSLTNRAYAYYSGGTLHVRSPESYGYGLSAPGAGDAPFLTTVQHEYGHHLTHVRMGGKSIKPWMNEGMSEWLAGSFSRGTIVVGFNDGQIGDTPLDWADSRIFNEETQVPAEVGLAYALSANGVRYIAEARGGIDQFWALADRYVGTRDWEESVRATFGQSWAEFQAAYRAWLQSWANA